MVYGKAQMARECLCYLKQLKGIENASIVIVDNCSPDKTYDLLKKWFGNERNIYLLRNASNQGFAKGNNLGYVYARNKLGCDFLIVMNSDVYIKDVSFINQLKDKAEELEKYEVVGPDIVNNDGHHSNPLATASLSSTAIKRMVFLNDLSVLYYRSGLFRVFKKNKTRRNNAIDQQSVLHNIMPHGACVIYTNKWVEKEDKAFYPGTFLFCEELFLYDYIIANGYKSIYWPDLKVNHIGDGSIDGDKPQKKIFINSCHAKSLRLLLAFRKDIVGNWNKNKV